MAVMQVVHMAVMANRGMAAVCAVLMGMCGVLGMMAASAHGVSPLKVHQLSASAA